MLVNVTVLILGYLMTVDEPPDFRNRSVLKLGPGLWRMRNGHTAEIEKTLALPYKDNAGKNCIFVVWKGKCLDCNEHKTWNENGTYAAVGKHSLDILGPK